MLPAIADLGSLGFTAIGDTHEQANALYARMVEVLDMEASAALEKR